MGIHCKSKDDDLGNHILNNGQEFSWKFKTNFIGSTLFFCDFTWGFKPTSFAVYDRNIDPDYRNDSATQLHCFWEARLDGFYPRRDNQKWRKINNWPRLFLISCFIYSWVFSI
ncbi:hypothetical protein NMG60_11031877 [Bertholletia excelsa]